MNNTIKLLPDCVLPGCSNPVERFDDACRECRTAFGDYLAFDPERPGMTERRIEKRDRDVRAAYAAQLQGVDQ